MQGLAKRRERQALCGVGSIVNALLLSACGSGATSTATNPFYNPASTAASMATAAATTQNFAAEVDVSQSASAALSQQAAPQFHVAPVVLDEPGDADSRQPDVSAQLPPHTQNVPVELSDLSTRRLTLDTLRYVRRYGVLPADESAADSNATPMATGTLVATYTPAQIRAAYGLPALPASMTSITSTQAAQLGAGQTIYIVDAHSDPNIVAELAAFNQKFGLPGCTTTGIATTTTLPLAAASTSAGCTLSVVYNTASGTLTSVAPAYDSGWATEIALDVQWSHAIAPRARIILIEAPDASLNSLLGGVSLADTMGPGVVSMSFAASEGSWTSQVDAAFSTARMSYLAAAGDAGAGVNWPAVSPHVLAIGGTSLKFTGSGARSETVWSGTGGGVSQYTATPSYQTRAVPGMGTPAHRSVSDVSFNADPSTGQYVAVIASGSSSVGWLSAGGTSLSTPQWAGVLAVANALRAQSSLAPVGAPHSLLYTGISTVASTYAGDFLDVTLGADGTCSSCYAKSGYDLPTGLGTPNVAALLNSLSTQTGTGQPPAAAPTVATGPTINASSLVGSAGRKLTGSISFADSTSNSLSITISGVPSGMSFTSTSNSPVLDVTWASPVKGSYTLVVSARDGNGLTGTLKVPVVIASH
jgi:subtilase family serine protease